MNVSLLFILFFTLCACGKKPTTQKKMSDAFLLEPEGSYSATLLPYDSDYSPGFKGLVTVSKYGDNFLVKVKYKNGPKGIHQQGLYRAPFCYPVSHLGPMLIPFDGDLSALDLGSEGFPTDSNFDYEQTTSYSLMLSNSKLHQSELQLENRVVVIHADNVPAACGILTRINLNPDDGPEKPPVIRRPKPPHHPPVVVQPDPPEERPRTFWQRLRDRLGRWWHRIWGGQG